jgi:predicted metal-dependent hydrolase
MDANLRAGIAIFNAGGYHGAHDAWEEHWLDLAEGTDDELFLHGLIQFTAAVYHARNRNWSGATGLATSSREYLESLPERYRGVDVGAVRSYLGRLARDTELIERRRPLALTLDGDRIQLSDLQFEGTCIAAHVLAEERADDHPEEEAVIEQAIEYARADLEKTNSAIVPLLFDYVREPERRGIIVQRLGEHVQRRRNREEDVSGLFEPRE